MGGSLARDTSGNRTPDQISLAKSLAIIGAAAALDLVIGNPATPAKRLAGHFLANREPDIGRSAARYFWGVVFYGLLALFPAVTALVSCYGLFARADTINDHLSFLEGVMPAEA